LCIECVCEYVNLEIVVHKVGMCVCVCVCVCVCLCVCLCVYVN